MGLVERINGGLRWLPTWALYIAGGLPLVWLLVLLFTGGLGIDPVKVLEHRLGKIALQFLVAGLMVTPARRLIGLNLIKFRRALGLLTFLYIALHLTVWLALDIQFYWGQIWADIIKRPYITVGMTGFIMLLPLAVTSNDWSIKRLGALGWRRLHKLIYPAAVAGGLHYVWLIKGWQIEPLIYLGVVLGLLTLRICRKRRRIAAKPVGFAQDAKKPAREG